MRAELWERIVRAAFSPRGLNEQIGWLKGLRAKAKSLWDHLKADIPYPRRVSRSGGARLEPRRLSISADADHKEHALRSPDEAFGWFHYSIPVAKGVPSKWSIRHGLGDCAIRLDYDRKFARSQETPSKPAASPKDLRDGLPKTLIEHLFHPALHLHWEREGDHSVRLSAMEPNPFVVAFQAVIQLTPCGPDATQRPGPGLRPQDEKEHRRLCEVLAPLCERRPPVSLPPSKLFGI